MRIYNTTQRAINVTYANGTSFSVPAGGFATRPAADVSRLAETAVLLALFTSGQLFLANDDGGAYTGAALPASAIPPTFSGLPMTFTRGPDGSSLSGEVAAAVAQAIGINKNNQASQYHWQAFIGQQANKGPLQDRTANKRDAVTNTVVFPSAYQPATIYTTGQVFVPTSPNGFLYRVTTANGVAAGTEPATYPTTIGATTTTGGGMTITAERGGYGTAAGLPQFYSVSSAQLAASGGQILGMLDFDMAAGDSLFIGWAGAFNATNGGFNTQNLNEAIILSNVRPSGAADRRGIRMFATGTQSGTAFNDLCLGIFDGTTAVKAAHLAAGAANHPLDGNYHSCCWGIDGQTKMLYQWADGVPRTTVTDYAGVNAGNVVAWNGDLSTVTGSTQSDAPLMFGTQPATTGQGLNATSFEIGAFRLDILVFKGRGLPVGNDMALHVHQRQSLIPASITQ